jgi:Cytochrome C'
MKTSGLWLSLFGFAVVAAAALLVQRAEAADNAGIKKIVELIKAGKNDEAKAAAKSYAKAHDDLDELMGAFKTAKKKGITEAGVEQSLVKFGRDVPSPAALGKADYQDMGAIVTAIGMITEAIPAPKTSKGTAADWVKWSKELNENGAKLQAAVKSKTPADVKALSTKINATCNSCHSAFKG